MGINVPNVGRIILEKDDPIPLRIMDWRGGCMIEIVDGQYRIEKLDGEANVQKNSPAEAGPKC